MTDTTFNVSPEKERKPDREVVDYVGKLRAALLRPIEQHWLPRNPVVACWANVFFPYFKYADDRLYTNPYLNDWKRRLDIYDGLRRRERPSNSLGMGFAAIPNCVTSVPLKVCTDKQEIEMRLVGGLLVVTQNEITKAVEPECGWVVTYESPVDEEPTFMDRIYGRFTKPRFPESE